MNKAQKIILCIALTIIILTILFPPWIWTTEDIVHRRTKGYHFILTPPSASGSIWHPRIDLSYLAVEWLGVSLITIYLFLILKTQNKPKDTL